MKRRDIIRRAGRSLRQAKARTLLTSLAIAVGAFTLTVSIAAGEGSRQYADKLVGSNVNPQALFIVKDNALFDGAPGQSGLREYDPDSGTTQTGVTIKQLTQADIDKLSARDDVENVQPIYQLAIQYLTVEGSDKKFVSEIAPYDSTIRNETSNGTLPPLGTDLSNTDIVMPQSFAEILKKEGVIKSESEIVGKKMTLTVAKPAAQPTQQQLQQAIASGDAAALQKLTSGETKDLTFTVRALTRQSSTALVNTTSMQLSGGEAKAIADYMTEGTSQYQKYTSAIALAKEGKDPEAVKEALTKSRLSNADSKRPPGIVIYDREYSSRNCRWIRYLGTVRERIRYYQYPIH